MIIDKLMYKKETTENLKKQYLSRNILGLSFSIMCGIFSIFMFIVALCMKDIIAVIITTGFILMFMSFLTEVSISLKSLKNRIDINNIEEKLDKLLKGEKK